MYGGSTAVEYDIGDRYIDVILPRMGIIEVAAVSYYPKPISIVLAIDYRWVSGRRRSQYSILSESYIKDRENIPIRREYPMQLSSIYLLLLLSVY